MGETTAALVAERAAGLAADPEVGATLRRIAEDESRHAALAWRTLAWAARRGGPDVIAEVRAAAAAIHTVAAVEPVNEHPDWNRFGQLDAAQRRQSVADARNEIVFPMLERLLA